MTYLDEIEIDGVSCGFETSAEHVLYRDSLGTDKTVKKDLDDIHVTLGTLTPAGALKVNGIIKGDGTGNLSAAEPGKDYATADHRHDSLYAPKVHNHDTAYSPIGHNHDGSYAPATHNHDTLYAAKTHDHAGVYAIAEHDHSGVYSPTTHNHDSTYAAIGHNHDSTYAKVSHTHVASAVTAGTFAGKVQANSSAMGTLGNAQLRDIYIGTAAMTPGTTALTTGVIYIQYE